MNRNAILTLLYAVIFLWGGIVGQAAAIDQTLKPANAEGPLQLVKDGDSIGATQEIYLVPPNAGNDFQTSIGSPPIRIPRLAAI